MPAPTPTDYAALLDGGCPSCHRRFFKVRAIAEGVVSFLDGEPASAVGFEHPQQVPELARVYRIECSECGAVAFSREDCPLCISRDGLARALDGRNGLTPEAKTLPAACPQCGYGDLLAVAHVRMHAVVVMGSISRRVVDAEPHEPGFHISSIACPSCEQTIAQAPSLKCAVCGRSSLMKRPG